MKRGADLWGCAACGRDFATRNQVHSCGRYQLDDHFAGKSAEVRTIFDRFLGLIETFGPVVVIPERSRIAFHVRMSFAQVTVRRSWITGHLVLARRTENPLFERVETLSLRNHVHHFRIGDACEVEPLRPFVEEAYAVGCQKHLA